MKRLRSVWLVLAATALTVTAALPSLDTAAQRDDAEATAVASPTEGTTPESQAATHAPSFPFPTHPVLPASASPTTIAPGLELLYYYVPTNDGEEVVVLGEYRNTSDQEMTSPYLYFVFLDADGDMVASEPASPLLSSIKPGESTPFELRTTEVKPGAWETEEIRLCETTAEDMDRAVTGLEVTDIADTRRDSDWLAVEGKVTNNRNTSMTDLIIKVVVYRDDGKFVGFIYHIMSVTIPPGETAAFIANLSSYNMPGLDGGDNDYDYRLWAEEPVVAVYSCSAY